MGQASRCEHQSDVRFLCDIDRARADIQVKTLVNEQVTERTIAAEFDRLSKAIKAREFFVLFVGGHGRSIAGEGWFYIPQDFDLAKGHVIGEKDAIGPTKLAQWLAKVPAQKSSPWASTSMLNPTGSCAMPPRTQARSRKP